MVTGLTVGKLMRPALTSVERQAHLAAAAYLMKNAGDTALVVIDDATHMKPLAVVTETDVAHAVADGQDPNDVRISDLVAREPVTVAPETTVNAAADLMLSAGIH